MLNAAPAILHAIDTTGPGGAETVFLDLAQLLTLDNYHNIAIIKGPGWVEEQLKARAIRYYMVPARRGFAYYFALYKLIKKHDVKLIQAHLLGSALTYSLLSLLVRVPLVATLHGRVDVNPNEKWIFVKNKIMQLGVNKLIAVSRDLASYIEQRGLFKQNHIATIYNGVDVKKYAKGNAQTIRAQLNLNADALLIGSVGNVRPAKAYSVLIAAAKMVLAQVPNAHFIIAGHKKPELMVQLEAQMQDLGLSDHVHFMGFQNDSAEFLAQMDVFALSSSSEGFSIATLEAMATGLPVVATRCGGPEEILRHEQTGLLCEANNPHALASALMAVIGNENFAQSLVRNAKQCVAQTFSMEILLQKYRVIYQQLLAQKHH